MRILSILLLSTGLSRGEDAPVAPEPPAAAQPAPAMPVDLDFTDDFPLTSKRPRVRSTVRARKPAPPPHPAPASASVPASDPDPVLAQASRSWIYWTLGFSAMAAGSAAWYLHWDQEKAGAPTRIDQVFTDDPD